MPAPRSSDPTGKRTKSAPSASSKPTSSSKGPDSKGKKRVRVVEPDSSDTEAVPVVEAAPKPKAAKGRKSQEAAPAVADKSRKDLRDKSLSEIAPVVSAEAPAPAKGALKKSLKKAAAAPAVGEEESAGEGTTGDDDEEEIDFLKGFESGGEDSSDEEEGEGEEKEFKVEELPALSREEAGVQKKLEAKAERKKNAKSGTVYLGRVPHGFHEEEMQSYFSQFGEVTRLRLSRNKRTGSSKHYAFIEFAYASVAAIVQETMDNYLLSGHILVCKIVPDDEVHPKLWIGANRKFRPVPKARADRVRREAPKTEAQKETLKQKLLRREQAKREQLAALGIDYDFSGYANKAVEGAKAAAKLAKKEKVKAVKGGDEPAKKKARKSV